MGIQHLKKVEEVLKTNKSYMLRGTIRKQLIINNKTLDECLDYLIRNEKVICRNKTKRDTILLEYKLIEK